MHFSWNFVAISSDVFVTISPDSLFLHAFVMCLSYFNLFSGRFVLSSSVLNAPLLHYFFSTVLCIKNKFWHYYWSCSRITVPCFYLSISDSVLSVGLSIHCYNNPFCQHFSRHYVILAQTIAAPICNVIRHLFFRLSPDSVIISSLVCLVFIFTFLLCPFAIIYPSICLVLYFSSQSSP